MKLQFSHITKTGGSSLELSAKDYDIHWGLHNKPLWKNVSENAKVNHREPWHTPLSFADDKYIEEVLRQYEFFTIVRNPYTRAVSEYFCLFGSRSGFKKDKIRSSDINVFNKNMQQGLQTIKNIIFDKHSLKNATHWQQQHLYIFKNGDHIIKPSNIIKYELYSKELNKLFDNYQLPIKSVKHHVSSEMCKHRFTFEHLSKENINLINEIYYEDFILLDYKLL